MRSTFSDNTDRTQNTHDTEIQVRIRRRVGGRLLIFLLLSFRLFLFRDRLYIRHHSLHPSPLPLQAALRLVP